MIKANIAVCYVLDRIQTDPDLAWHMIGTEAHALLMEAEAEELGKPIEKVREDRQKDKQPEHKRRKARLPEAEKRIEALERLVDRLTGFTHSGGTASRKTEDLMDEVRRGDGS